MNENDLRVVRITNIADFDFTGELGARYAGRDFVILKGRSLMFPYNVGHHLAKHLAQQIMLRQAPTRDASQVDGRGSDAPLWNDQTLDQLMAKIMTEVYEETPATVLSEGDRIAAKVAEINKAAKEVETEAGGNADASTIEISETETTEVVYKDKAEVMAELGKRGVKYDARSSKAKLEGLLK